MNVLLAGGAGYIGSHTCVELIEAGHTVVIADNFSNSCPEAVKRVEEITGAKIPLYEADVCDRKAVDEIFAENKILPGKNLLFTMESTACKLSTRQIENLINEFLV